jgi:hypothetical protein
MNYLFENGNVHSMIVHGSFTRHAEDEFSDLDMIIFVKDKEYYDVIDEFHELMKCDKESKGLIHSEIERFPWFGHLESLYFPGNLWLTFEFGFVKQSHLNSFFIEPDAWVLKGRKNIITERYKECLMERIKCSESMIDDYGFDLINLYLKFKKAIIRGHFWNAYNYCTVARKMFFDFKRLSIYGTGRVFVGNPERRIEDELDEKSLLFFDNTAPRYCAKEIIECFFRVFFTICDNIKNDLDPKMRIWIEKFCIDDWYQKFLRHD